MGTNDFATRYPATAQYLTPRRQQPVKTKRYHVFRRSVMGTQITNRSLYKALCGVLLASLAYVVVCKSLGAVSHWYHERDRQALAQIDAMQKGRNQVMPEVGR